MYLILLVVIITVIIYKLERRPVAHRQWISELPNTDPVKMTDLTIKTEKNGHTYTISLKNIADKTLSQVILEYAEHDKYGKISSNSTRAQVFDLRPNEVKQVQISKKKKISLLVEKINFYRVDKIPVNPIILNTLLTSPTRRIPISLLFLIISIVTYIGYQWFIFTLAH